MAGPVASASSVGLSSSNHPDDVTRSLPGGPSPAGVLLSMCGRRQGPVRYVEVVNSPNETGDSIKVTKQSTSVCWSFGRAGALFDLGISAKLSAGSAVGGIVWRRK